jgi:hypothetical protein
MVLKNLLVQIHMIHGLNNISKVVLHLNLISNRCTLNLKSKVAGGPSGGAAIEQMMA